MQRPPLKVSMFEIYIQTSASLISFGFGVNPHVKNMNSHVVMGVGFTEKDFKEWG